MLSRFFIDRPIFATVLSVVITLIGGISLVWLPIAQYPQISPPGVAVSISYPGANAQTVAQTVGAPIEQQVNGVPGMLYMSSQSGNDGSYTLNCTFEVGTNLDAALVMVQNRVTLAMPLLPTAVQRQGITIRKKTPDILMIISFTSSDGRYDDVYLSNYALINVRDELMRVDGVSDVNIFGERDYSLRVWLDPQKLAAHNMTAPEVADAIRTQNVEAAMGQIGQAPMSSTQAFQLPLDALGRLSTPRQFGDIVVKARGSQPLPAARTAPRGGRRRGTIGQPQLALGPAGGGTAASALLSPATTTDSAAPTTSIASGVSPYPTTGTNRSGGLNLPIVGSPVDSTTTFADNATGGGTTGGGATDSSSQSATMSPSSLAQGGANDSNADNGAISATNAGQRPQPPAAAIVRLRDVAQVEIGALNYNQAIYFDGKPSVGLAVFQLPGTNALEVGDRVRETMKELSQRFPEGVDYTIGYDTTPFVRESIEEVFKALFDAVILVAIVVLFFLQDWRAMILPMIDVPVSLIGTFAVMALLGYSLNNVSLFGLVLAIGIVVDDAIVVLENI
jgi:multidrug efflux pump